MAKKVRVLATLYLDGKEYMPNTVLELDDKQAKSMEKDGTVDTAPEAVAYCTSTLGQPVIKHTSEPDEVVEVIQPAA
ncbi:hypothetical protein [Herminiimonas sp. CN]|uniref:hypothetical protein n=1 Tax=Herminiimonas sp. CN TaxID=1349818 RepID=UPI000473A563|nr:hypothetical protein [Herminiimonas sp. CN]